MHRLVLQSKKTQAFHQMVMKLPNKHEQQVPLQLLAQYVRIRANCPAVNLKCAGRVMVKLKRVGVQRCTDKTFSTLNFSIDMISTWHEIVRSC